MGRVQRSCRQSQAVRAISAFKLGLRILTILAANHDAIVRLVMLDRESATQGNRLPGQHGAKLNVALHAQSQSKEQGFVAGSEVTTAGLAAALRILPEIGHIRIFAPFMYNEDMTNTRWPKDCF